MTTTAAGARVYTPWIWLITFLPYVLLPLLFGIDTTSMISDIDATDPTAASRAQLDLLTSPAYLALTLGGSLAYGLCVLFAFLDRRELIARGVPRPFHWAWTLLSSPAYVIGRSIIVRRRTGKGIAPMWVAIGLYGLSIVVSLVWAGILISQIMQAAMQR